MQANWLHFWCFPPRLLWALPIVMTVCLSLPSLRSLAPRRRPPPKRHCPAIVGVRPISGTKSDAGGDGSRRGGQYAVQLTSNSRTPSAAVNVDLHARLSVLPKDRAKDMQAEARALSRATNATAYHPEVLAAKFSSRPFKVVSRMLEIFTGLGSFALKLVVDQRRGQLELRKLQRAAELTEILMRLGPTFVKIGQGLSTRPDLCPPEYIEELSQLQLFDIAGQSRMHFLPFRMRMHLPASRVN